jgi:L-iditol 2-dehydrogenase
MRAMRACVLFDVGRMEIRTVPDPDPGPRDVVIRIGAVGVCGTDLQIVAGHANYNTDARGLPRPLQAHPQILGHEMVGVVEALGADAGTLRPDLRVGDRVTVDQGLNCSSAGRPLLCEYCASGDSHQCERFGEIGITGLPGGFAERVLVPAVNVLPLRSSLEFAQAVMHEPLSCIIHSLDLVDRLGRFALHSLDGRAPVRSIMIFGGGPAGLMFTQYLRRVLNFDGQVFVSEPNPARRALAASFGVTALDPGTTDVLGTVLDATAGRGVECVIDAAGVPSMYEQLPALIRNQATILLYAHAPAGADMGLLNRVKFKEPRLLISIGGSGPLDESGRPLCYQRALTLLEDGRISVAAMITHRYAGLDAIPEAFTGDHRRPDYIKGIVLMS